MSDKVKVAVLVSGGGTNLQALIDKEKSGELAESKIVRVIASKDTAYALQRAADAALKHQLPKRRRKFFVNWKNAVQSLWFWQDTCQCWLLK